MLENLKLFADLKYEGGEGKTPQDAVQMVLARLRESKFSLDPILNTSFENLRLHEKVFTKLAVMLLYEPQVRLSHDCDRPTLSITRALDSLCMAMTAVEFSS